MNVLAKRALNPILRRQILVLQQQFLIDAAGVVSEQPRPFVVSSGWAIVRRRVRIVRVS
jgi:hypothetical protein